MRYIPARLLLPVILLLTGIDPCHALQVEAPASDELRIKADTIGYNARKDSYTATGKVRIDWQGSTMFADSVSLLQKGVMASADGNVLVRKDDNTIQGDSAFLNLETGKGEINNGRLFIPQGNFRISGKKMEKTGPDDYRIENGSFTTCDGDAPSWKFSAAQLDVTREKYAVGRHAVFYIKDVPLLYIPYMVYPVREERMSGFLLPVIKNSTKRGFQFGIPYYLAISPSQEATVYLDVMTKRGVGTGVDYRYMMRSGARGA